MRTTSGVKLVPIRYLGAGDILVNVVSGRSSGVTSVHIEDTVTENETDRLFLAQCNRRPSQDSSKNFARSSDDGIDISVICDECSALEIIDNAAEFIAKNVLVGTGRKATLAM